MHLPSAHLGVVEGEKIVEYLLNPEHPDNGGKAAFFASIGFARDDCDTFAEALRTLARTAGVTESMETEHGKKYIVDGALENPLGKRAWVRTVWIVDAGKDFPRLVTAYPLVR